MPALTPLAQLDLNLLVALDALLAERSVTRAAERLGLTQPAMSNALARLRRTLDDPLLVRGGGGMVPTPKALALAGPLRDALGTLEEALESLGRFEPARARRVFRIAASEEARLVLLPPLLAHLSEHAPGVAVRVAPPAPGLKEALERGQVDLALGAFRAPPPGHLHAALLSWPWVSLSASPPPASLADWAQARHLVVGGPDAVDEALSEQGMERRVVCRVPGYIGVSEMLLRGGFLLTTLAPVAKRLAREGLHQSAPPLPLAPRALGMLWHARHSHDPAQCWLRGALAESLDLTPPPLCGAAKEHTCLTED